MARKALPTFEAHVRLSRRLPTTELKRDFCLTLAVHPRRRQVCCRERSGHRQTRCLVPASSYCEPDSCRLAQWHWFAVNGDEDRRLFAFPGVWQRWNGPVKKAGPNVEIDTYAFLTTAPNALTDSINHERMPVLLSAEADFEAWLSGTPTEAFALAGSFDPAEMRIVQSGKEKVDLLGQPSAEQASLL